VPLYFVGLFSSLVAVSLLACFYLDPRRLPSQSQVHLHHLSAHLRLLQSHMGSHSGLDSWARYSGEMLAVVVDVDMDWSGMGEDSLGGNCCPSFESALGRLAQIQGLVR